MDLSNLPTTGDVARRLELTEQRLQTVLRGTPGLRPPLVAGKRRWRPEDVAALERRLAELSGEAPPPDPERPKPPPGRRRRQ